MRIVAIVLSVCFLALFPPSANAHKVIASVFASGDLIEGEIGFSNGDMANNVVVEVFDEAGTKLGETKTDGDGFFTFKPEKRIVHIFRANLGAGHIAETRMELDELPRSLAAANTGSETPKSPAPTTAASSDQPFQSPSGITEDQRAMIAEVVRQEMRPLRREIMDYKEKNDFQTILGGIGYIVGIFGIGFYIAARRKLSSGA